MDASTLFTALGFLLALVLSLIGGAAYINAGFDKARDQQIDDDKALEEKLTNYVDRLKTERDRTVDSLAVTVASIRDSAATRQEMNLTETRLTTAISELKISNIKQFDRIEGKLEVLSTVQAQLAALVSSVDKMGATLTRGAG